MTAPRIVEADLGPVIGDVSPWRPYAQRSDGPDPLPHIVLSIIVSAAAVVFAALFGVAFWLMVASVAHADEVVRVPRACEPLALRFGVPLVLTREQAAAALVALDQIQSADADVRRCRRALTGDRK
jgi:hypothetical protein